MKTLQRAARAVALEWYLADYDPEEAAKRANEDWDSFVWQARAVLMAVREPELNDGGVDIYRAGFEAMFDAKFKDEYPMMSTGWEAMIDAILNDGEGE